MIIVILYDPGRLLKALIILFLISSCQVTNQNKNIPIDVLSETAADWEEGDYRNYGYERAELTQLHKFIVDSSNTTGMMVIIDGKMVLKYGDIEELSFLASCRKSVLSILYGKYVDNGIIDLNKSLKDLEIDDNMGLMEIEKTATIEHLLTARSGVYHPASNSGDNTADAPPRGSQVPGEYFLYNNWDFNAAGAVFEKITGRSIYNALRDDLAIPLGMQDFDMNTQKKTGNSDISRFLAYHMWLSTRDLARIGQLMLNKGRWNGKQLISESWISRISSTVTPRNKMNPDHLKEDDFGFGYMWWIWDGDNHLSEYEGSYTAKGALGQYLTIVPQHNMVVAHKTKEDYRRSTSWNSYKRILDMLVIFKGN